MKLVTGPAGHAAWRDRLQPGMYSITPVTSRSGRCYDHAACVPERLPVLPVGRDTSGTNSRATGIPWHRSAAASAQRRARERNPEQRPGPGDDRPG